MVKPPLITNEIYHIYNRGVEKRDLFLDDRDYFRFINCLFEFNDINPALSSNIRYMLRNPAQVTSRHIKERLDVVNPNKAKKPLVDILTFCLMPNHYHLLVRQVEDNGTVKFMKKMGSGYANYFNLKNKRVGSLFQGRFKAIHVNTDDYLKYLTLYIHLNPLDLVLPEWRTGEIKNSTKSLDFISNYRWSSYSDYSGKNNFPLITKKDFLLDIFDGVEGFKKYTREFIKSMDIDKIRDLILE